MKRIFLLLAVVGLVSVDAPAAGMNLLELVGLGANEDSGARQESKGHRRQPIRVERETATQSAVANNVATNDVKAIAKPVAEAKKAAEPALSLIASETVTPTNAPTPVNDVRVSPMVMTNFVERVVTNVIDRIATNYVDRVTTNYIDRVIDRVETNFIDRVIDRVATNYIDRVATNFVDRIATNFVDRIVTNVIERVVTNDLSKVVATSNVELVAPKREPGPPRITSNKVYYDRKEGYAVFTGKVHVDSEEYQLHAKKAYVFFEGTNELKRIVASGGVAITNGLKRAYGSRASYYHNTGMVILYGDDKTIAEVVDGSKGEDQSVRGSKIKFWTMSEQVEVLDARISSPVSGGMDAIKSGLMPK